MSRKTMSGWIFTFLLSPISFKIGSVTVEILLMLSLLCWVELWLSWGCDKLECIYREVSTDIWYIWLTFQLYNLLNDHPQSSNFHSGFPSIHLQSSYWQLGFSPIFNNIFGMKKLSFKLYYLFDLQLSILRINIIMSIHNLASSSTECHFPPKDVFHRRSSSKRWYVAFVVVVDIVVVVVIVDVHVVAVIVDFSLVVVVVVQENNHLSWLGSIMVSRSARITPGRWCRIYFLTVWTKWLLSHAEDLMKWINLSFILFLVKVYRVGTHWFLLLGMIIMDNNKIMNIHSLAIFTWS